jgi:hypothetical protein
MSKLTDSWTDFLFPQRASLLDIQERDSGSLACHYRHGLRERVRQIHS